MADDESKLDPSPTTNIKIAPPIHRLPIELLMKIIEKVPRTQWPALELVDPIFFRNATLLAWGSIREVDIDRDFIYSETKTGMDVEDQYDDALRKISGKTESILKKLIDRSPLITSLSGVSLLSKYSTWNTTAIQYLTQFEHLETIKIETISFSCVLDNDEYTMDGGIHLINLTEFLESTRSRATLKEILIQRCYFPDDAIEAGRIDRLRAALADDDDPSRQLLQLESFSLTNIRTSSYPYRAFIFYPNLDTIDVSRMTKLSFGYTKVETTAMTTLINGAPRLQHLDFAFDDPCGIHACQNEHLQSNKQLLAALETHQNLTSLGFNAIWDEIFDCACKRFEPEFLQMLNTIGPRLEKFDFEPGFLPRDTIRISDICAIIRTRMPLLKSLGLYKNECGQSLAPADLRAIADFKELEEFIVMARSYSSSPEEMNDVLSAIISKSIRLKRLIVGGHYQLGQGALAELCKLSDLVDLRIRADQLTKENFVAFSQSSFAATLEVLRVVGCIDEGAESGLIELIAKAKRLRVLTVYRNVSNRLLECLADSCPNLETLHTTTDGITFDGVQMLVDRCPNLRRLEVDNLERTFKKSLKDLKFDKYRKPPYIFWGH